MKYKSIKMHPLWCQTQFIKNMRNANHATPRDPLGPFGDSVGIAWGDLLGIPLDHMGTLVDPSGIPLGPLGDSIVTSQEAPNGSSSLLGAVFWIQKEIPHHLKFPSQTYRICYIIWDETLRFQQTLLRGQTCSS